MQIKKKKIPVWVGLWELIYSICLKICLYAFILEEVFRGPSEYLSILNNLKYEGTLDNLNSNSLLWLFKYSFSEREKESETRFHIIFMFFKPY